MVKESQLRISQKVVITLAACFGNWYVLVRGFILHTVEWFDIIGLLLFTTALLISLLDWVIYNHWPKFQKMFGLAGALLPAYAQPVAETDIVQAEVTQTVPELDIPKPVPEPDIAQAEATQAVSELDTPKPVPEPDIAQAEVTQTVSELEIPKPVSKPDIVQAEVTQAVSELDVPKPVPEPDIAQAEVTQTVSELEIPKPVSKPDIAQAEVTQAVPELDVPKPVLEPGIAQAEVTQAVPELDVPKPVLEPGIAQAEVTQAAPELDASQTETPQPAENAQPMSEKDALQVAWETIPEENPYRRAVKLLCEGYTDGEISIRTGIPLRVLQNAFYVLRDVFGDHIIRRRNVVRKKMGFRKSR